MKRARLTNKLKNAGNRLHNVEAMQNNFETELLPFKRSNNGKFNFNIITHVYCKHCFGLFKKVNLYKHITVCPIHESVTNSKTAKGNKYQVLRFHSDAGVPFASEATPELKEKVYPTMKRDGISMVAQSDPLIAKFGSKFYNTHREICQVQYVSSKLRSLAILVVFMRELNSDISGLSDCIDPKNFDCQSKLKKEVLF